MKRQYSLSALVLAVLASAAPLATAATTALDAYVVRPDPSYRYAPYHTHSSATYTTYFVHLTSQQWRTPDEVDRVLWEHELLIIVPRALRSTPTALVIINGGDNDGELTQKDNSIAGLLAVLTGAVTAVLNQVPNQPLAFADEPGRTRSEDEILAYGMDKYLTTGDPEWLAQLPMTKAVVRAMDTVQALAASASGPLAEIEVSAPQRPAIDDFIVLGGSKRGWATWLAAAVEAAGDARIRAILPASADLLNLDEQFVRHWEAYGFYAPAITDYVEFDLPCRGKTPAGRAMLEIIDPYEYRDRFTLPKLLLNSAGDQFFLPDSSRFYFADLPEPKFLRYTLNTDHTQSQNLLALIPPALAWLNDAREGQAGPQFSWSLAPGGSIQVQTVTPPSKVLLWQATNPAARDFRLATIGPAWTSTELQDTGGGVYIGYVPPPPQGWTAFTVELTFPGGSSTALGSGQTYTTDVRVTPPELPFKDTDCPGYPAIGPDTPGLYQPDWRAFELRPANPADEPDLAVAYPQAGAGWLPLAGDWDGDGRDGLGLFRPDTGVFYLKNPISPGGPDVTITQDWVEAGDIPVVGDWDGDGVDTLGVYSPDTRAFKLRNANTAGPPDIVVTYDQAGAGWLPLAGDWDGDGQDGLGLYRPDTRTFYLNNEIAPGGPDIVIAYGQAPASGTPLAGDWDGDGQDTLGWYQPDTGVFYLTNELSSEGRVTAVPFGPAAAGWLPVVGLWD